MPGCQISWRLYLKAEILVAGGFTVFRKQMAKLALDYREKHRCRLQRYVSRQNEM
jgi:hypothetical protein